MASLNPAVALTALADVNVELAVDGLARNFHLELLSDMGFVEESAAVGTAFRQLCLVDLIDLLGAGRLAVGLDAVVLAGLAARLLGIGFRIAFGEGSGLALAGTEGRVELTAQAFVLGLQVVNSSLKGLAVSTPKRFHTRIIRSIGTCSCTDSRWGIAQVEVESLIKYHHCSRPNDQYMRARSQWITPV
jgi:hypothetical protein